MTFPWTRLPAQTPAQTPTLADEGDGPHRGYVIAQSPEERDFETALEAFANTAQRVQYLWIGFLTVMLAFAVTTANVSHKMLLLQEGVKLPLVDLTIPLEGYATIGPFLFLILHLYVLTMLIALARTGKLFEDALAKRQVPEEEAERLRARLGNAFFALLLSGPKRERSGALAALYTLIALTTVALLPVMVLFLFQLMYLPYQSDGITWWHRFAVWIDLILVWTLWWSYRSHWGARLRPAFRPVISFALVFAVTAGGLFFPLAASFPCDGAPAYRRHEADIEKKGIKKGDYVLDAQGNRIPLHALGTCTDSLDAALRDLNRWTEAARGNNWAEIPYGPYTVLFGSFPNRLILRKQVLVDDTTKKALEEARAKQVQKRKEKGTGTSASGSTADVKPDSASVRYTRDFEGRRLRAADFTESDLTLADFKSAELQGAVLASAWFGAARFDQARMPGASLSRAQLQGASLDQAQLHGASLDRAQLQGALLYSAQLQGASLGRAQLQGASLGQAQLQGASLDSAQLQGASLFRAQLQGASLIGAQLQGASLNDAQLQGASLVEAQLQGASLWRAQLQGASLDFAQLQGASLDVAQLQGASLGSAHLQGASLGSAHLQGASLDFAGLQGASLEGAELQGASLVQTNLSFAWLYEAQMDGAVFSGSDFTGAVIDGGAAWRATGSIDLKSAILAKVPDTETEPDWGMDDSTNKPRSAEQWRDRILAQIPEGQGREVARKRLQVVVEKDGPIREKPVWAPVFDPANEDMVEDWRVRSCDSKNAPDAITLLKRGDRFGRSVLAFLRAGDRAKWLAEFRAAKAAKPDDRVSCEAARTLTDAQMQELEQAFKHADAFDARQREQQQPPPP